MKGNTKIGTLHERFEIAWKKLQANPYAGNKLNESGTRVKDPSPDWKEFIIRPIVKALCEKGGYKLFGTNDLRQFGLRSHVPVTFEGKNDALYIDFSHNGGWLMLTDFDSEKGEDYPKGSIGYINGFNYTQITFEEDKTIDDVVDYILSHKDKFITTIEKEVV
jgi:hypothetical protein